VPHVTFNHGILNKPPEDQLLQIWLRSLAGDDGLDLDGEGVTYSMVYWADVLYEKPEDTAAMNESLGSEASPVKSEEDESWRMSSTGGNKRTNLICGPVRRRRKPVSPWKTTERHCTGWRDARSSRMSTPLRWAASRDS